MPGTTTYSSDNSCAADTISYSDSTPAQTIEIKHLMQSAQLTPVIGLRCRQPSLNPRTRRPSRLPSASGNLCNPFNPGNLCNLNSPNSLDLRCPCRSSPLPISNNRKLVDITLRPEFVGHSENPQSGGRAVTLEAWKGKGGGTVGAWWGYGGGKVGLWRGAGGYSS